MTGVNFSHDQSLRATGEAPRSAQQCTLETHPNPSIREVEGGRAHGLAPLCRTRLDPGGVGVGLALHSSGPAETRGRQAAPLRRAGCRRIGDAEVELTERGSSEYLARCINEKRRMVSANCFGRTRSVVVGLLTSDS
ncbi:hypothetical protein SBA2_10014 [Acidobacteriia bacterium SbA2]|nr:hypothetical protein SBA2_10014 [Acidobacteriia bacterium SbA2]